MTTGYLISVGSPIVLQRRGSVYGANVPMITGNGKDPIKSLYIFYVLDITLMYNNKLDHQNISVMKIVLNIKISISKPANFRLSTCSRTCK